MSFTLSVLCSVELNSETMLLSMNERMLKRNQKRLRKGRDTEEQEESIFTNE